MLGSDVMQLHVPRQGAKERNSLSDEHRYTSDNQSLHKPCAQKSLNRNSAVDIDVMDAVRSEFRNDLGRRTAHLLRIAAANSGEINGSTAEHHYAFVPIRP